MTFDGAKFPTIGQALFKCQVEFWLFAGTSVALLSVGLLLPSWWKLLAWVPALGLSIRAIVGSTWRGVRVKSDHQYERFMRAFRTLTLICEKSRNRKDAARFYKLELKCTRLRPSTSPMERFVSWLYDLTADYGDSMVRPILSLAVVVLVFALGYWSWEGGAFHGSTAWAGHGLLPTAVGGVDRDFVDALSYSAARAFPFGPWAQPEAQVCDFAARLLATSREAVDESRCLPIGVALLNDGSVSAHQLLVSLISTLESIFALTFFFLFGLSVRRRFQIN